MPKKMKKRRLARLERTVSKLVSTQQDLVNALRDLTDADSVNWCVVTLDKGGVVALHGFANEESARDWSEERANEATRAGFELEVRAVQVPSPNKVDPTPA